MKPPSHKGIISSEKIEEIRRAANIRDIVSDYVTLKKAGRSYVGLCPFHAEKTPSFHVFEEKGNFKCFGCGAGGDVFRFCMMMTGMSFPDAVKDVARRYGVSVPQHPLSPRQKEEVDQKQRLYAINEEAARYFREQLCSASGEACRRYLANRLIYAPCIEAFGLGYAPPRWEGLVSYLKAKGQSLELAEKAGLIRPRPKEDGCYDYFRDRVMFPIQDARGQVIGFGGRILEAGEPKYLNSPESPVYSKGSSLYGLLQARQAIQKEGRVILVEGYFDLLSLFSSGIQNVAAPLGTALTRTQLQILKRYSQNMVVVFDGDDAGMKGMARALPLFLSEGIDARARVLPGGQDPDDFVRQEGADAFRALIAESLSVVDFYLNWLMQHIDSSTVEGKRSVLDQMAPHLSAIPDPISRGLYLERVAQRLGVRGEQVAALLQPPPARENTAGAHPKPQKPMRDATERLLLKLVLQHPDMFPTTAKAGVWGDLQDQELADIASWMQRCVEAHGTVSHDLLLQMVEGEPLQELIAQLAFSDPGEIINPHRTMVDCVVKIKSRNIQKHLQMNTTLLREAQEKGDYERVNKLNVEHKGLKEQLQQLKALR